MTLEGVKRHRSLVADARGRIWLARTGGLAMTDPARADSSVMPALSHVEALSADGTADRPSWTPGGFLQDVGESRSLTQG